MSKPSLLRRVFSAIWRGITRLRLALSNLLFLAMLAIIYFVYIGGAPEPLPERAALLLNMAGTVVDEKTLVDPFEALLSEPTPADHEVAMRDVLDAIDYAAEDPAITALVMELDALVYVGLSKTQEIVAALERFRESGKPILAVGDYYTQDQYLLASHADEIIMHPMGGVALEGYGSYRNYFREALEKLTVNVHVFRAGDHKSAVEPFIRDDMSPGEKEVTSRWLQDLWSQYTAIVETRRELTPGAVDDYVNNFANRLAERGGDTADAAVHNGFVDKLMGRGEANDYVTEIVGASNDDGLYEAVVFERYVQRKRPLGLTDASEDNRVAVITAQGTMLPGEQPPGTIGGDTLARMIRSTAEEEGVEAIVLRINSGGGSMFASEVIREQLLYARELGVPIVTSMGAVAASGGYYIAASTDEIWATPGTITGSIGVFAAFPTFEQLLARMGVHTDGVGTTALAGSLRADMPLNPQMVRALNSGVEFAYRSFLDLVERERGLSREEVEELAQGKVWSASDALAAGLVDEVGSLDKAIEAAAARAGLEDYEVDFVEPPLSPRDQILKQLANVSVSLTNSGRDDALAVMARMLRPVREASEEIAALQDPGHLYMRCLGCAGVR